jgi:hypothetical protein
LAVAGQSENSVTTQVCRRAKVQSLFDDNLGEDVDYPAGVPLHSETETGFLAMVENVLMQAQGEIRRLAGLPLSG